MESDFLAGLENVETEINEIKTRRENERKFKEVCNGIWREDIMRTAGYSQAINVTADRVFIWTG